MSVVGLIFPNQLYANHPVLTDDVSTVYLVEDSLFYGDDQYPLDMHPLKIRYHDATLTHYENELRNRSCRVKRVHYEKGKSQLDNVFSDIKNNDDNVVRVCDPHDYILLKRLHSCAEKAGVELKFLDSPGFINSRSDNEHWRSQNKSWNMAGFYKHQRRRLNVLVEKDQPVGGQWSFDEQNRRKIPKKELTNIPPFSQFIDKDNEPPLEKYSEDSLVSKNLVYPTNHQDAQRWLESFYQNRFQQFGPFEDAIVEGHNWLYHSVLTPMLNVGLLNPSHVVDTAIDAAVEFNVPLNSLEGFVRQIIGWREYVRASYDELSVHMRNGNHWNHHREMPVAFYEGTTGIHPVDDVIRRVNNTGYCHHIERLMVLGGFMFLCEIKPDAIYTWFMEKFIDSYDWVMVPNVYGMSQHADGGSITTKPYFSGSNYIIKMSHYKKGEWSEIWDALFWRWIIKNQPALASNHRWSMMVSQVKRMDESKRQSHIDIAEHYLKSLELNK